VVGPTNRKPRRLRSGTARSTRAWSPGRRRATAAGSRAVGARSARRARRASRPPRRVEVGPGVGDRRLDLAPVAHDPRRRRAVAPRRVAEPAPPAGSKPANAARKAGACAGSSARTGRPGSPRGTASRTAGRRRGRGRPTRVVVGDVVRVVAAPPAAQQAVGAVPAQTLGPRRDRGPVGSATVGGGPVGATARLPARTAVLGVHPTLTGAGVLRPCADAPCPPSPDRRDPTPMSETPTPDQTPPTTRPRPQAPDDPSS
jgi:hypothetical protein